MNTRNKMRFVRLMLIVEAVTQWKDLANGNPVSCLIATHKNEPGIRALRMPGSSF
jgi:hypothetical protein